MQNNISNAKVIHVMADGSKPTTLFNYQFDINQIPFYTRRLIAKLSQQEAKTPNEQ